MKLQDSVFQKAEKAAQKKVDAVVSRVQELQGIPANAGDCLGQAKESARGVQSALSKKRNRLKPAAKNLVSVVGDRLNSLIKQAESVTDKVTDVNTFSKAGKQLAKQALSAGIANARQAGRRRIEQALNRTASKAVFGAMEVIANRQDALYKGLMGILIQRELRDLRKLEKKARAVDRKLRTVSRAIQIMRAIRDAADGSDYGPSSRAVWTLETAARNLRNARETYRQRGLVPEAPMSGAARSLKIASRVLSSSPVSESIMQGIRSIDLRSVDRAKESAAEQYNQQKRRARRARQTMEDAWRALEEIPGDVAEMGKLYGQCVSWAKLAIILPDTLDSVNSVAWLIKAGERLRFLVNETEDLKKRVEALGKNDNAAIRAELSARARTLALGVEALEETAGDPNRRNRPWYENALSLFESSFLQGGALSDLRSVELGSVLIKGAASIISKGGEVQQARDASRSVLGQIRSARHKAQQAARRHEQDNGAIDLVRELLRRAGIDNAVDVIINGQLPSAVKTAIAGGALALPEEIPGELPSVGDLETEKVKDIVSDAFTDKGESPCKEAEPTLPADAEVARVSAIDKAREKKGSLTGSTQAMKASDGQAKTDLIKYSF